MAGPELDIRIDSRQVLAMLDSVPEFVRKEVRGRFATLGRTLRNELRNAMPKRTGKAASSIFNRFDRVRDRNDIAILVGGNLGKAPYLGILEVGGNIRPKQSGWLAIPLNKAADRHGKARFRARDLRDNPGAYGFVRSWVRDRVVLGERPGGAIEPVFALRKAILFSRAEAPKPIRRFRDRNVARIQREVEFAVTGAIEMASKPASGRPA